jgi:DNA repair exonuclease SbcCD ATPase subunit
MMSEKTKSIVNEEERKRLISEITKMKDVLDSFKYGLNFEDLADELFKTIDRQTVAVKQLDDKMSTILERMAKLEERFKEGVKVIVSSAAGSESNISGAHEVMMEEDIIHPVPHLSEKELASASSLEELKKEAEELRVKISRLFEKENEYEEMAMTDPASSEDYDDKVRVAREMRQELEEQLKKVVAKIGE